MNDIRIEMEGSMFPSYRTLIALTAVVVFLGVALPAASADEALDKALEAFIKVGKKYDILGKTKQEIIEKYGL